MEVKMWFVGAVAGGVIGILLLSFIIELMLFKKQEPPKRAISTAGLAYVLATVLYGFGSANGGPFVWDGIIVYLPGAAVVYVWFLKRYQKSWTEEEQI
jgi:Ca2+/Na+ antiporter